MVYFLACLLNHTRCREVFVKSTCTSPGKKIVIKLNWSWLLIHQLLVQIFPFHLKWCSSSSLMRYNDCCTIWWNKQIWTRSWRIGSWLQLCYLGYQNVLPTVLCRLSVKMSCCRMFWQCRTICRNKASKCGKYSGGSLHHTLPKTHHWHHYAQVVQGGKNKLKFFYLYKQMLIPLFRLHKT